MTATCRHCGKTFDNTKALGSHIHYVHDSINVQQNRSEEEKDRFRKLFNSCLSDKDIPKPRKVEKIERAIIEIPEGVSSALDQYREAYRCAIGKEKLLKEIEEEVLREPNAEEV